MLQNVKAFWQHRRKYISRNLQSVHTVSYTHLDVYKRQELLTLMQTGNLQKSTVRMDRTFQEKVMHEVKLLEGRGLSRQLHFTNVKLSEGNAKKRDFRHWSDSGREWREVIVEAAVSDKYLHRDSGKVIHESIYPHGSILLRQSRHIRHNEVGEKDRQKEQLSLIHI